MEEQQMDENKRLAIALGAPTILLLGGLLGGGVSGAGSPPASVALTEANESFSSQLSDTAAESPEEKMDPEVEKILYPYRETKEDSSPTGEATVASEPAPASPPPASKEPAPASAPTPAIEASATDESTKPDTSTDAETTTLKPVVDEPVMEEITEHEPETVDPEPASPPSELASINVDSVPDPPTTETVAFEDSVDDVAVEVPTDPEPASPPISEVSAVDPDASSALLSDEFVDAAEETTELALTSPAADPVPPAPISVPEATEDLIVATVDPEMASPPVSAETVEPVAIEASATETIVATESPDVDTESATAVADLPSISESPPSVKPVSFKPEPAEVEAAKLEAEPVAKSDKKPFLGVGFRDPSKSIVTTLYGGSTAQRMGVMLGDEIVSANGTKISDMASLKGLLQSLSIGEKVSIKIKRGKETFDLQPHPLGSK